MIWIEEDASSSPGAKTRKRCPSATAYCERWDISLSHQQGRQPRPQRRTRRPRSGRIAGADARAWPRLHHRTAVPDRGRASRPPARGHAPHHRVRLRESFGVRPDRDRGDRKADDRKGVPVGARTKRAAVEDALRLLVKTKAQGRLGVKGTPVLSPSPSRQQIATSWRDHTCAAHTQRPAVQRVVIAHRLPEVEGIDLSRGSVSAVSP